MESTPLPAPEAIPPSSLPQVMASPERRKSERMVPESLIYISFEPDNGGIVVNVSEGGLGFNAVAPVEQTGKFQVWFSADSRKIEAECEVAWTDETRRTGGLRFHNLSPAARQQIERWTKPAPAASPAKSAVSVRPVSSLAADAGSTPLLLPHSDKSGARVLELVRLGAFSRGLLTGVLLSTIVGGALLFHSYRRQFGDLLVRWGEHFRGEPQPHTVPPGPEQTPASSVQLNPVSAAAPPSAAIGKSPSRSNPESHELLPPPTVKMLAPPRPQVQSVPPVSTAAVEPAHERLQSPPASEAGRLQVPKLEPAPPAKAASIPAPSVPPPSTPETPTPNPAANRPVQPAQPLSSSAGDIRVQQLGPNWPTRSLKEFADLSAGIPLGRYFELGKFNAEPVANQIADKAAQAGFHTVVLRKPSLWSDSYRVLTGPYANEHEAEAARGSLKSSGFSPRNPATKSRSLTLYSSKLRFDGALPKFYPIGEVEVSWVAFSADATVRLVQEGVTVTTVQGKWVNRNAPYAHDAIVYRMTDHGARRLLEIQFSGAKQTLVLADNGRPIIF
jgi:hypothetical protein